MSWTVPTGCYYAVAEDDPQWHFVYYGAGKTVPTEHAPNNPYVDERDLQNFILIDFANGYIYVQLSHCTITIKSNNTFTAEYDGLTYGSYHTNIIASNDALAQYNLTLAGVAFNFGNGSGMLNKSALLHSSRSYKMRFSFAGRSITSATIPTGIETLWHAFEGCTSLTTVSALPSGITDMGYCFQGCTSLTTAPTIPASVIYLNHCFKDCTSLTTAPTITMPSAIIKMGYCFQGCTSLTTAPPTMPANVERMGYCFQGCASLTTAPTIPASVAYLNQCFKDCTSLEGAVTINASPSDITEVFANTVNDIVLLGTGSLESIASSYENVYVWSLSTTMTASRDEAQTTTVEISVDVSRFKTGTLASLTLSKDGTAQSVTWNDPSLAVTDIPTTFTTSLTNIGESATPLLSVVATDAYGSSTVTSVRIPVAFYTIDVQAGGKEIAFGAPAYDTLTTHQEEIGLLKCDMEAQFNEAVHAQANKAFINGTIDPTQIPAEGIMDRFQIIDVNGDKVASFHAEQTTPNGRIGAGFNANRIVNGTSILHGMMFHIDSNGTRTVYLNYPQAFRDALGIVDYVVEEGTSTDGRSRWRKWNSGRAEFWYHYSVTGVTTAVWTAPIYYMDTSTFSNIWNGVFNGAPFSVHCDSNSSQFISVTAYAWNSSGITSLRYLSVGAKSNNTVPTSIYAVGTWK